MDQFDTLGFRSKFLVQRWYSGLFGVGTMHWINSNSMHQVWKLNEDMLKQKYRMHNLYVQVSLQN